MGRRRLRHKERHRLHRALGAYIPARAASRGRGRLAPRSRPLGNGYATEAATAALDEAFDALDLPAVCSIPQAENPASVRVAERLGLQLIRPVVIPATDRRRQVDALLYESTRRSGIDEDDLFDLRPFRKNERGEGLAAILGTTRLRADGLTIGMVHRSASHTGLYSWP